MKKMLSFGGEKFEKVRRKEKKKGGGDFEMEKEEIIKIKVHLPLLLSVRLSHSLCVNTWTT